MSLKVLNLKNLKSDATKKSGYMISNKTETVSEILLYGTVGQDFWGEGITAKQFAKDLQALPSSIKEIHLRVNSPGGSVFEGSSIFEHIKSQRNKGKKVIAYVDGLAASIASYIILAADEVVIGDGAMVMIHKPWAMVAGNSFEMEKMINVLDKIESQMVSAYRKKTGMSAEEIEKLLAEETWYTSDEALEAGFADSKIEASEQLKVAACMIESSATFGWKKKPEMKGRNSQVKSMLKEFNSEAKTYLKKKV